MQNYSWMQALKHAGKQRRTTQDGSHMEEEETISISSVLLPVKDADVTLHTHPNHNSYYWP